MADPEPKEKSYEDQLIEKVTPDPEELKKSVFRKVKEKLENGELIGNELPREYEELERIIPLDAPERVAFQRQMESLLKELLPDFDTNKRPILFLLSDTKEPNGYIIPTEKQSIICLDKSLFKEFDNINQLAFVLLHEMTHMKVRDMFGDMPNTQTEETICDIRPLVTMSDRGWNTDEAKKLMIKWEDKKVPTWYALVDAHPLPHYRVESISAGLATLRQLRGTRGDPVKGKAIHTFDGALAKSIGISKSELERATHPSFISQRLRETDFDHQSPLFQLQILEKLIPELKNDYFIRIRDFGDALNKIKVDNRDDQQISLLERMADTLLDNPLAFNELYRAIDDQIYNNAETRGYPVGRIAKLAVAAGDFIEAEHSDDPGLAEKKAKELVGLLESMPTWQGIRWPMVELPHFELESLRQLKKTLRQAKQDDEDVLLPWHNLAEWAVSKRSDAMIRALLYLGAYDARLSSIIDDDTLNHFHSHLNVPRNIGKESAYECSVSHPRNEDDDCTLADLIVHPNGHVLRINTRESEIGKNTGEAKFRDALDYQKKLRRRHAAENGNGHAPQSSRLTLIDIDPQTFLKNPTPHLAANEMLFLPLLNKRREDDAIKPTREEADAMFTTSQTAALQFLTYLGKMIASDDKATATKAHAFARDFFLGRTEPLSYPTINTYTFSPQDGYAAAPRGKEIHSTNAYLNFIRDDTFDLFSPTEKMILLRNTSAAIVTPSFWRKMLRYEEPKTLESLIDVIKYYEKIAAQVSEDIDKKEYSSIHNSLAESAWEVLALRSEISLFLSAHGKEPLPFYKLITEGGKVFGQAISESSNIRNALTRYFRKNPECASLPIDICKKVDNCDDMSYLPY